MSTSDTSTDPFWGKLMAEWKISWEKYTVVTPIPRSTPTYRECVVEAARCEGLPEGLLTIKPFKHRWGVHQVIFENPNGEKVTVTVSTTRLRDVTQAVKDWLSISGHPLCSKLENGHTAREVKGKTTFRFEHPAGGIFTGPVRCVSPRCFTTLRSFASTFNVVILTWLVQSFVC